MTRAQVGEMEFEYETFGLPSDPAILLVMGLGAQLIHWPERFCQLLADGDFESSGLIIEMQAYPTNSMGLKLISLLCWLLP